MMRSMFAAISGLRNHQTFMDVVGNNIANVNTTGFKQSRVTFQDILSQTVRGGSSAQGGRGGTNPAQVGLGVLLGGIDVVQTQGTLQSTGKLTDMAIQGEGFFVLSDGNNQFYARDGAFDLGTDGSLVNPVSGLKVMGWQADATGRVDSARPLTNLRIPLGQGMEGQPSTEASVTGNLAVGVSYTDWVGSNPSGGQLTVAGTPTITPPSPHRMTITADATGLVTSVSVQTWSGDNGGAWSAPTVYTPNSSGAITINGVDYTIAKSAKNKTGDTYYTNAQQTSVTLYDSLGGAHDVRTIFQKTSSRAGTTGAFTNNWSWRAFDTATNVLLTPTTGDPVLGFDNAGRASTGATSTLSLLSTTVPPSITNGARDLSVSLDFSAVTQLAGTSDLAATTDGAPAGTLSTFFVGQSGEITGIYSNGLKRALGQLAMASFSNPTGLLRSGGNLFTSSVNSGTARIGTPDSNGRGQIATGFLEMSNVDLAQQFTNMIIAERGFQANSRVITTSDEILQDLVNLKR